MKRYKTPLSELTAALSPMLIPLQSTSTFQLPTSNMNFNNIPMNKDTNITKQGNPQLARKLTLNPNVSPPAYNVDGNIIPAHQQPLAPRNKGEGIMNLITMDKITPLRTTLTLIWGVVSYIQPHL